MIFCLIYGQQCSKGTATDAELWVNASNGCDINPHEGAYSKVKGKQLGGTILLFFVQCIL